MRRLEVKDAEIMRIAVQQEILRSEESRYDHRLHYVMLGCSELSCPEVAKLFDAFGFSTKLLICPSVSSISPNLAGGRTAVTVASFPCER